MHRAHLLGCLVGVGAAVVLLLAWGVDSRTLGVLALALACPAGMLVMMRLMANDSAKRAAETRGRTEERRPVA